MLSRICGASSGPLQSVPAPTGHDSCTPPLSLNFTELLPREVLDLVAQFAFDQGALEVFGQLNRQTRAVARASRARRLGETLQTSLQAAAGALGAEGTHRSATAQRDGASSHRTAFAAFRASAQSLRIPTPLSPPESSSLGDWASLEEACRVVRMSLCLAAQAPGGAHPNAREALIRIGAALMMPCSQWAQGLTRAQGADVHSPWTWLSAVVEEGPNQGRLKLASQSLTRLPPALWYTQAITHVDLNTNAFTEVPEALAQLPALAHLAMVNNRLQALPAWLATSQMLTSLHLSDNHLTLMPDVVWQLPHLRYLYLEANNLEQFVLPPQVHRALRELRLDFNPLTELPALLPQRLPALEMLSVAHTEINALPGDFGTYESLQLLDISGLDLVLSPALSERRYLGLLTVEHGGLEFSSDDGLSPGAPAGFEDLDFETSDEDA